MCEYMDKALQIATKRYRLKVVMTDTLGSSEIDVVNRRVKISKGFDPITASALSSTFDPVLHLLHETGHWVQLRRIKRAERARFYHYNKIKCEAFASRWAIRTAKRMGYRGNFQHLKLCFETYTKNPWTTKDPRSAKLLSSTLRSVGVGEEVKQSASGHFTIVFDEMINWKSDKIVVLKEWLT